MALTLLLAATSAPAAVIPVAAGAVEVGADGVCSLREAMDNANANSAVHGDCVGGTGDDELVLAVQSTYEIFEPYPTPGDPNGLPVVTTDALTISGRGSVIQRSYDSGVPMFRLLQVGQTDLMVTNLTFENGFFVDALGQSGGGAILVQDGGLETFDTDFVGNAVIGTGRGGAVLARGSEVVLTQTRFFDNETEVTDVAYGGGALALVDGSLDAERCAFVSNNADGSPGNPSSGGIGGGLLVEATADTGAPFDVLATIKHSTISTNTANSSGGVALVAQSGPAAVVLLVLDYVTVVRNDADGLADGIGLMGNDQAAYAVYSNSILHSNGHLLGDGTPIGDDCQVNLYAAFTSSFGNLLGDNGNCPADFFDDFQTAKLAPDLGVNVVVDFHQPVIGGLLTDHAVGSSCTPGLTFDQKGKVRGNGPGSGGFFCDIGAVELYSDPMPFLDGFESSNTSSWSQTVPP